ncbi:SDR family NAD(P)-dependent oxidoreductase [Micromonospora sp. NPDC048898]|uniref:SDR family NAD(P)-dependent oxidoreductase n=1 Tax=Micromonospora sp. NPDC048898 TaxID=3364260 RepID=UPI003716671D
MKITGSIALVIGANRGLGRHFAGQLLERGATKVYATARTPERIDIPGVETLRLDITDPRSVEEAASIASDVTLLVNNAGISTSTNLVTGLHLGMADTDMSASYDGDNMDPADVVRVALDGIEAERIEVLADEWRSYVKASLANDPSDFYKPTGQ